MVPFHPKTDAEKESALQIFSNQRDAGTREFKVWLVRGHSKALSKILWPGAGLV
jgi:hypothetical protein